MYSAQSEGGEAATSLFTDRSSSSDNCDVPLQHYHGNQIQEDPNFTWISHWGRRYIRSEDEEDEPNLFPNDEREHERQLVQHYLFRTLFGGRIVLAPLDEPRRILDIGAGTGIWAQEVASQFPRAQVTGLDIGPPPESEDLPDNVTFITEDASKGDWGTRPYSYIHSRMLLGCFEDFKLILKHSFKYLEPGGWLESQELYPTLFCEDGSLTNDNPLVEYIIRQDDAAMQLRRPLRIANKLKKWYEEAGFVNVREEVYTLPINGWPSCPTWKMLGRFWCRLTLDSLPAFSYRSFHAAFGWNQMETETYLINVKKAVKNRSTHAYQKVYVVMGQKPQSATVGPLP